MSSMIDLPLFGSPKRYGASTKTCYEYNIPKHSLCRSISDCTADFSERDVRSYVNIFSHKSNSRNTSGINFFKKHGLHHIIHDVVLDILYPGLK